MKILVSDYDKTFYLNNYNIKKNIKEVTKFQNLGNIFIIATGRSYYDFKKKVDKYHIPYDYVFLNHGATIIDKNDKALYNFPIKNLDIENIKTDLELDKIIEYFCCSKLDSRVNFDHPNLTKIAIRYLPFVDIPKIKETIENKYQNINAYLVSTNMLEIISNDISKSKAIKLLIDDLNINKDNVYTIGDGETDIEMIKDYNGYAMKKSIKMLKEVSKGEYKSLNKMIKDIYNKKI